MHIYLGLTSAPSGGMKFSWHVERTDPKSVFVFWITLETCTTLHYDAILQVHLIYTLVGGVTSPTILETSQLFSQVRSLR